MYLIFLQQNILKQQKVKLRVHKFMQKYQIHCPHPQSNKQSLKNIEGSKYEEDN